MIVHGNETVLVQGITGTQATFWSERMKEYGTKVVGGVNPKKAGIEHLGLPVWGSATDAAKDQDATSSSAPTRGAEPHRRNGDQRGNGAEPLHRTAARARSRRCFAK